MPLRQKGGRISISLTVHQREELVTATTQEQCVRQWKHYQVILLLDQGRTPAEAVAALGCGLASVYNWARAWRRNGLAGLRAVLPRARSKRRLPASLRHEKQRPRRGRQREEVQARRPTRAGRL